LWSDIWPNLTSHQGTGTPYLINTGVSKSFPYIYEPYTLILLEAGERIPGEPPPHKVPYFLKWFRAAIRTVHCLSPGKVILDGFPYINFQVEIYASAVQFAIACQCPALSPILEPPGVPSGKF
jgi:hypothetical protein